MPQITGTPQSAGQYKPVFVAQDSLGALSAPTELDITVNTAQGGQTAPDMFPLPVVVELLINGTWTDVTGFIYQRDGIHITGGKSERSGQSSPASCTLTFNNRDGRFSPRYINGPYYPYLQQNTQIRISLNNATSSSGNIYSGYRFWGEVAEWPPVSDVSGQDVYVSVTASGPLRRINQGGGEGSALQRYYASLTGLFAPIAYWPCEEDPLATQIGSGVMGGENMIVTSGTPLWKAIFTGFSAGTTVGFNGSAPIGVVNNSTWTGITSTFGTSGDDLFLDPGTWKWVASTTTVSVRCTGGGGGGVTPASPGGGAGGGGGGGGECAGNAVVAVTPGKAYTVTVPAGGAAGKAGGQAQFSGDLVTVTAHGGSAGSGTAGGAGGTGGTGGTTGYHHNGGAGGTGGSGGFNIYGGGGGSSGGTSAAGNAGGNAAAGTPGAGGAAVAGGGAGGAGGQAGRQPGGGGGGGQGGFSFPRPAGGANGAPGSVELIYTASSSGTPPPNNVIRFILFVPSHGGNNTAVLVRALGTGTIARLDCQYRTGGNLRLFGYDGASAQLFDSGNLAVSADSNFLMVSMELATASNGTQVAWSLSAIKPGAAAVTAKASGTITGTIGSVSEIIVDPNGDVTKSAIGHISLQYALIPLWQVSRALDGHQYEAGPERFIRLANEQALGNITEYAEQQDHWGFEDNTVQGWTAANGTLANSSFSYDHGFIDRWPPEGARSLLLTANGSGQPSATGPAGASGQPVPGGDVASLSVWLYAPVQLNNAYAGLKWYDSSGTFISESDCADTVLPANQPVTLRLSGAAAVAPTGAAFCAPTFGNHHTDASGTLLYADNITLAPHMGPQTRKAYKEFLQEIQDLDQGILKEAKELWGMHLKTRISITNMDPSVVLDYSLGHLSPPLAPVIDTQNVKNNIIVHRHKGSKVEVTLDTGQMSIEEPPAGTGRYKKTLKAVAAADEQLAALAAHLLNVGTAHDERYPTVTVNLTGAAQPGNSLAPMMSAVAGVEIGDMIELVNLPFWYPSATSKQMVIGYDETINSYGWTITWNCVTYTPFIQVTSEFRRW